MKALRPGIVLLSVLSGVAGLCADEEGKGKELQFSARFSGSTSTLGQITKFDPSVGYRLNRRVGISAGIPLYFVRSSAELLPNGASSRAGIGNVYADLRLTADNPALNFASSVTVTAPTGDTASGFSTGRATIDWNNQFNRSFSRITPFANLGVANTIADSPFFIRPFTSLGLVGHLDGGTQVRLRGPIGVGASGYAVLPSGEQKIFSKVVRQQVGPSGMRGVANGRGRRGRVFETDVTTVGGSDVARDHGFSTWVVVQPSSKLDVAAGYTRSARYALDTVSFTLGFRLGSWTPKGGT